MAARYEILLKDTTGAVVARFDNWISLEIHRRINAPGSHSLVLNGLDGRCALFVLDGQVEVWREDVAASPAIARYREYEGFHRTSGRSRGERNQNIFISKGPGYEDLLRRRIILNTLGSPQAQKGPIPAETAMKEYADEQAGPGAVNPPRLFETGVTAGLTIQFDAGTGGWWYGDRSFRNLLEVEQDIAISYDMWFDVIGTGPATFQFRASVLPYGADRTIVGLNPATGLNAAGNRPVVFSDALGTAKNPEYYLVRDEEGNRCLSLGPGAGAGRLLSHFIPAPDPGLDSPWNNCEIKIQSADLIGFPAIDDKAVTALKLSQYRENFNFEVEQAEPYLYGRDYFFGDRVTAVYENIVRTRTIVGVTITIGRAEAGLSEIIDLELSDVISTAVNIQPKMEQAKPFGWAVDMNQPLEQIVTRVRDLEAVEQ